MLGTAPGRTTTYWLTAVRCAKVFPGVVLVALLHTVESCRRTQEETAPLSSEQFRSKALFLLVSSDSGRV
uniref:Putative secreted protein n=1 Tax=Ixodes ricinus TaxID=34613 RepID=A0A6B0U1J0_IXORI